jgi:hypothetical protein
MRGHFQKQRTPLQHTWPLLAVSAIQSQRVHSCNVIGPKTTLREATAECEHVPTHCAPTKERPEIINVSVNGVSIGLATRWSRVSTEYKLRNSSVTTRVFPSSCQYRIFSSERSSQTSRNKMHPYMKFELTMSMENAFALRSKEST